MNTKIKLPDSITKGWFLMTRGGEGYDSRFVRGSEIFVALIESLWSPGEAPDEDAARIAAHLADTDNWNEVDGYCVRYLHEEEDGSVEFFRIADARAIATLESHEPVGKLLVAVARAAHTLADNSEESGPVTCDADDFAALSKTLDALDALPELPAPYIGTGPAKAEHAMGLSDMPRRVKK